MSSTRLERITSIAEIVSAVAVIISLVYLGYEVRQNTVAVASGSYQAIHDAEDAFWQSISGDPSASDAWERGLAEGMAELAPQEKAQFSINARRLIYLFQNVHYQRRKGVVDDELWDAWAASLDEFLALPGFAHMVEVTRPHLSGPFLEHVDSRRAGS